MSIAPTESVGQLDQWIERLYSGKPISEQDVIDLTEKVSMTLFSIIGSTSFFSTSMLPPFFFCLIFIGKRSAN